MLGAAYVFTALIAVSAIGAGGVAAATITGQLTASVVIDRLGLLGLEQQRDHAASGCWASPCFWPGRFSSSADLTGVGRRGDLAGSDRTPSG